MKPNLRSQRFPDGTFRFLNPALRELNWDFTGDLLRGLEVDGPSQRRIIALIEKMLRADAISEQLEERNPNLKKWYLDEFSRACDRYKSGELKEIPNFEVARIKFTDRVSQALYDELLQLHADLKKMLRRYKCAPTANLFCIRMLYPMDYGPSREREWENWCVEGIVQFYDAGLLSLFRRCRQCQVWFFSLSEHKKYCSERCRQKFASTSSEFKMKNRVYMRKYRKDEAERDKRAKELT